MYFVISKYITINGTPCVLELVSRLNEGRWIDANGSRFLLDRTRGEDMQLFLDPLTNVYSRHYFETYRTRLEGMEGVALIDVNSFRLINDRCGHTAGDAALRDIANDVSGQGRAEVLKSEIPCRGDRKSVPGRGFFCVLSKWQPRQRDGVCARSRVFNFVLPPLSRPKRPCRQTNRPRRPCPYKSQ